MVMITKVLLVEHQRVGHDREEECAMGIHDVMELLVASWLLSAEDPDDEDARLLPTSHGVLDKAMRDALEKGLFPSWNGAVRFVDSRVGLRCVELPEILTLAQRSELTTVPNPSYHTTRIKLSAAGAKQLLRRLGVDPDEAKQWGEGLRRGVKDTEELLRDFPAAST